MPSAHTPQTADAASARRRFRRWRRARPFAGGLLLILSGVELFLSGNLDLGALQVHVGPTGFLSYVLPAMLVLCGALTLATPHLRLFYGIIGSLVAVYSLIGLNLGGFMLGLLLGIIGGALTIAWTPVPATTPTADAPAEEEAPETAVQQGTVQENYPGYGDTVEIPRQTENPDGWWGGTQTGPRPSEPEPPPYGTASGGSHTRILAITLVPVTLAAALVTVAQRSTPAYAGPCPTPSTAASAAPKAAASTSGKAGKPQQGQTGGQATAPQNGQAAVPQGSAVPGTAEPAPSVSPSVASAEPKSGGNLLSNVWNGLVGGVKKLLGGGDSATPSDPAPSASAASSQSPDPSASTPAGLPGTPALPALPRPGGSKPQARPTSSAAAAATAPCPLAATAADAGQPLVSTVPAVITSAQQDMQDFKFEGVVDLPTKNGTVRALKFTMTQATNTPFQLKVPENNGKSTQITSSELTIKRNANKVEFYTYKFTGTLTKATLPIIPITIPSWFLDLLKPVTTLTLTPDTSPLVLQLLSLITFPEMSFKDVTLDLAFVHSDVLLAKDMRIAEV